VLRHFVYTSTTSVFGDALVPPPGEPAAWVTEDVTPVPKKHLWRHQGGSGGSVPTVSRRNHSLRTIVLRTSRFFPEEDDNRETREAYADANVKVSEFLYRRVDIEDVVSAHLLGRPTRAIRRFSRNTSSAPRRRSRTMT